MDALARGVAEIQRAEARELVGAKEVRALLNEIQKHERTDARRSHLLHSEIVAYVSRHWATLADPLGELAVYYAFEKDLFEAFPALRSHPATGRALASGIANDDAFYFGSIRSVAAELRVTSVDDARLLIRAVLTPRNRRNRFNEAERDRIFALLFAAFGRGMGWTPWVKLFAVILAVPFDADAAVDRRMPTSANTEDREVVDARNDLRRTLGGDALCRSVAARLLDLLNEDQGMSTGLLSRPAETRAAFADALSEAIAGDKDVRRAAIEALLWLAPNRAADLAQFTAVRLVERKDAKFLNALVQHPDQLVGYAARAVRNAVFQTGLERAIALPRGSVSVLESLLAVEGVPPRPEEPPKTWLGDRLIETLIEQAVARVETQFAQEYADHGEEGEEKLLAMMFQALANRFEALDGLFEAAARAASSSRVTHISMRYRTVDKAEEGRKGVKKAKKFSADLCLIVDPTLDGRSLGRRVTLVQAKRLYRNKTSPVPPVWHRSFDLKLSQMEDLVQQTQSAVYFFQGPLLGGRGVPVIPARLVLDLAVHQGGSGAKLDRETVAVASRSLADWLTYDALALRIGDPMQELVEKAEGSPGSLPRRLLQLPQIEVKINVSDHGEKKRG